MKRLDLSGQQFGKLLAIRPHERRGHYIMWLCKCECGNIHLARSTELKSGKVSACGCVKKPHGHTVGGKPTKLWRTWYGMIQRCTDPNNDHYKYYGGRGIKVCKRWMDFVNFMKDMGNPPHPKLTIDRINNDGDYEPENCRWATYREQRINSRGVRLIEMNGEQFPITHLSHKLFNSYTVLSSRLKDGWPLKLALEQPLRKQKRRTEVLR